MMGRNEIRLNQATICKAVQFYLAVEVFRDQHAPKVEKVDVTNYGSDEQFTVTLLSREEAAKLEAKL